MSYTPEDQHLEPSIDKILDGISEFKQAADKRIISRDWNNSHILELNNFRNKFNDMELELRELKKSTS